LANIKSQKKRNRQNIKRQKRNLVYRSSARTAVKNARESIKNEKSKEAESTVKLAISKLDKTAQKGVIHKNNAARRKSRLMKSMAKMEK